MALFGKKKGSEDEAAPAASNGVEDSGGDSSDEGAPEELAFSPEKAEAFFHHADAKQEAGDFGYAMHLWLQGLRQDPSSMKGLEGFWQAAGLFVGDPNTKKVNKDTIKEFKQSGQLNKFLSALLQWGTHPTSGSEAEDATRLASKLGLHEQAVWLGDRALAVVMNDAKASSKVTKARFKTLMGVFEAAGDFERSVRAGELACRADPTDGALQAHVRNLSAQSTMTRGGYDQTGEEGGFRQNIKDADQQSRLEAQERVVRTEETTDRLIRDAQADHDSRPTDKAAITKLAQLLLQRGTRDDQRQAFQLYVDAHARTGEYRFREEANKIALRQAEARIAKLKQRAEAPDAGDAERDAFRDGARKLLGLRIQAAEQAVEAYPTEKSRKFELGRWYFDADRLDDAVAMFQTAKDDAKYRVRSLRYLGECFMRMEWEDEAVDTYRQAMDAHQLEDDATGMDLRYGLLLALQKRADDQRDIGDAEEAYKIASSIAIQQINFKDIRDRRTELKELVRRLRGD